MIHRIVERGLPCGVVGLAMCLLLVLGTVPAAIAGDAPASVTEVPQGTETPPRPTETPPPAGEGSGGIVPSPTQMDNEGVAPGQVTLSIHTSDGGMLPAGTTACIGNVCQTLSRDSTSGFKWEFERLEDGWQEIRVSGAASYDTATSSVRVVPGRVVTANVEIVRTAPRSGEGVGNEPPPAQDAPPSGPSSGHGSGDSSSSAGSGAAPEGAQQFAQVTDLPETGAGVSRQPMVLIGLVLAAGVMFALAATVRRSPSRRRG